jgi:hypothetical protein
MDYPCCGCGNVVLEMFPGTRKVIQVKNTDGTLYPIPVGSVVRSKLINIVNQEVADLNPVLIDRPQSLIQLTLPTNAWVMFHEGHLLIYDVIIDLPGGLKKHIPDQRFKILHSSTMQAMEA